MPRIDIPFKVEKQNIIQTPKMKIASGGQNYFYAIFDSCDIWKDITDIKAKFIRGDMARVMKLTQTSDNRLECEIPWEVLTKSGILGVGIFGGDRLPTNIADVEVDRGCCDENVPEPTPTSEPTPDWYRTHNHDDRYYTKDEIDNKPIGLKLGDGLKYEDGKICVDTINKVEEDNTKPITSGAVYAEMGNIELLLSLL